MSRIEIKNLCGGYDKHTVLKSISISITEGSFTAIAGPNGSGKSTLLKHMIGELKPDCGEITVDGTSISSLNRIDLARKISFVGQKSEFAGDFSVQDLVSLGRYCHFDEKSSMSVIEKSMEMVGIKHLKNRLISSLSGGEYQLAMISRALCQDTPIMLLDEITNNLDPKHELKILKLLRSFTEEGKTVVCILHNLNHILNYADNTIILKDGTLYDSGITNETLTVEAVNKVFDVSCKITHVDDRQLLTVY